MPAPWRPFYALMAYTGLRLGEVVGKDGIPALRWGDVRLDVRVHDLRHTFAIHAIQSGLPLPRLQKLLGHATPAMTMRYARHAPEAYFAEDASRIGASRAVIHRADTA